MFLQEQAVKTEIRLVYGARTLLAVDECVFVRTYLLTPECEVVARSVRASLQGMCRAERPGFESRSDHQLFISTFHLIHSYL